jgi:hypothetical protein
LAGEENALPLCRVLEFQTGDKPEQDVKRYRRKLVFEIITEAKQAFESSSL